METRKAIVAADSELRDTRQYLTFLVGGEQFGVETLRVKEIIEYGAVTPVPMMPPCLRGVINLRGAVVPVVDLRARFGGALSEVSRKTCTVIVEVHGVAGDQGEAAPQVIGVMVDAVSAVLEIPPEDVEPAPAFGARIRTDFIQGMGKVAGQFVILLDVGRVLSVDELAELADLSSPGGTAGVAGEAALRA